MKSINSGGTNFSSPDDENTWGGDFNPYAYPYFNADHHASTVYDLVVRFGKKWQEDAYTDLAPLVKQIQHRCQAHPKELHWKDSCGDTALHRLSQIARLPSFTSDEKIFNYTKYFIDIGEYILEAHPFATIARNNWKETPLHQFANHCGLPFKLPSQAADARSVIKNNPIFPFFLQLTRHGAVYCKNWWESYALHDACELQGLETKEPRSLTGPLFVNPNESLLQSLHIQIIKHLIQEAPLSLYEIDDSGSTPLDRAAQSYATSSYVVRILVQVLLEEHEGRGKYLLNKQSPLTLLISHYFNASSISPKRNVCDHIIQQLNENHQSPFEIARQLGSLWTNTVLLCIAQVYGTVSPISRLTMPLLHALIQTESPYCCVRLAMKLYPNELQQLSEAGETALTLSLLGKGSHERDGQTQTSWRALLEAEPKLASVHNLKGQLPLHIAISKHTLAWNNGLEEIFTAHPFAIKTRDPSTGLFPFMLAATVGDFSSTFELLRSDPSLMK